MEVDDDWTEVVSNFSRARVVWKRMTRILSSEGTGPWLSRFLFKAVVQTVLLFGVETWVINPHIGRILVGFQGQVARRLNGRLPWLKPYGKCDYTSAETAS